MKQIIISVYLKYTFINLISLFKASSVSHVGSEVEAFTRKTDFFNYKEGGVDPKITELHLK